MSKRAEELAKELYPDPDIANYNDVLVYREARDNAVMGRVNVVRAYKQAEKDTIESVCKWLEEHFVDMSHYSDRGSFGRIETTDFDSMEEMVNDLKKALEEQK